MRILITGGAGFIGSHVVDALHDQGEEIVVVDDLSTGKRENITCISDNHLFVGKAQDLRAEDITGPLDCIVHLAASASVERSWSSIFSAHDDTLTSTIKVLEIAKQWGCKRVVFASSAAVYGNSTACPISEDSPMRPQSPYGLQKLASEQYLDLFAGHLGLTAVALRFFNVYGPRQCDDSDYSGVIARFMRSSLSGQPLIIHGDGKQTRDFVFVSDVARAVQRCLVAELPPGRCYPINIGTGRETSIAALADVITTVVGRGLVQRGPSRTGDIGRSLASVERARRVLNFEAKTTLSDGLLAYGEWMGEIER